MSWKIISFHSALVSTLCSATIMSPYTINVSLYFNIMRVLDYIFLRFPTSRPLPQRNIYMISLRMFMPYMSLSMTKLYLTASVESMDQFRRFHLTESNCIWQNRFGRLQGERSYDFFWESQCCADGSHGNTNITSSNKGLADEYNHQLNGGVLDGSALEVTSDTIHPNDDHTSDHPIEQSDKPRAGSKFTFSITLSYF